MFHVQTSTMITAIHVLQNLMYLNSTIRAAAFQCIVRRCNGKLLRYIYNDPDKLDTKRQNNANEFSSLTKFDFMPTNRWYVYTNTLSSQLLSTHIRISLFGRLHYILFVIACNKSNLFTRFITKNQSISFRLQEVKHIKKLISSTEYCRLVLKYTLQAIFTYWVLKYPVFVFW